MADIETEKFRQIGIDLINEYRQQRGFGPIDYLAIDTPETSAFIRSIQLHEKTKQELADCKQELADYKQQVSDEVEKQARTVWDIHCRCGTRHPISFNTLSQFIIPAPKPDPLFDVMWDLGMADNRKGVEFMAARINEALTARGLEIREKNDGN